MVELLSKDVLVEFTFENESQGLMRFAGGFRLNSVVQPCGEVFELKLAQVSITSCGLQSLSQALSDEALDNAQQLGLSVRCVKD